MKKILKDLVKPEKPFKRLRNFKLDKFEDAQFIAKAKKYTHGNVTALIKVAVFRFAPKKSDFVNIKG